MASLGEKIEVIHESSSHQYIGGKQKENICLFTFDDCVSFYDAVHEKIFWSWPIGENQHFTSSCIYNKDENEYIVVINSKIIRIFTDGIEKGSKFTVNSEIFSITTTDPKLVLFKSGIAIPLDDVLADPKSTPKSKNILLSAQIVHFVCDKPLILIAEDEQKLFIVLIEGEQVMKKIPLHLDNSTFCSTCIYQKDQNYNLLILCDNGYLYISQFSSDLVTKEKLDHKRLFSIKFSKNKIANRMTFLSSDAVAIVTDPKEICVFDIKFGIVLHRIKCEDVIAIDFINNDLVIAETHSLYICHVSEGSITLSSVIGKHSCQSSVLPVRHSWGKTSVHEKNEKTIRDDETVIATLLESDDCEKVEEAWSVFWQGKNSSQRQTISSSIFMRKFIEKLCNSNHTWMPSLVSKVINLVFLSARFSQILIETILDKKDYELLNAYLVNVKDINEKDMVLCLNKILPQDVESLSAEIDDMLLNLIKLPYSSNILVDEFRNLDFNLSLTLMSHLSAKLRSENLTSHWKMSSILSWLCLLLDAHYAQIIIYPDAWQLLIQLQEIIAVQMELYNDLNEIDVQLAKIKRSQQSNLSTSKHFSYHVEIMSL